MDIFFNLRVQTSLLHFEVRQLKVQFATVSDRFCVHLIFWQRQLKWKDLVCQNINLPQAGPQRTSLLKTPHYQREFPMHYL